MLNHVLLRTTGSANRILPLAQSEKGSAFTYTQAIDALRTVYAPETPAVWSVRLRQRKQSSNESALLFGKEIQSLALKAGARVKDQCTLFIEGLRDKQLLYQSSER